MLKGWTAMMGGGPSARHGKALDNASNSIKSLSPRLWPKMNLVRTIRYFSEIETTEQEPFSCHCLKMISRFHHKSSAVLPDDVLDVELRGRVSILGIEQIINAG